jgi:hypothetical protein
MNHYLYGTLIKEYKIIRKTTKIISALIPPMAKAATSAIMMMSMQRIEPIALSVSPNAISESSLFELGINGNTQNVRPDTTKNRINNVNN